MIIMKKENINKKLKIIEFENNYSPIATQYNYSDDVISNKKEKIDILNVPKIRLVLMYIIIFMLSAMIRMLITYEITNLGMKKQEIDRHLAELKKETEALEFNYISNYDLKKIEEKAKEMGYVDIDNVTYIDIKK
jgi:hypothetical protein